MKREKVEVIIVGAGAAGCLFAANLAEAGKSVVVLEAGPPWEMSDLISSQIWGRRLKWGGPPILSGGEHRIGHNAGNGSGFGGAALHHYGTWPRYSRENFKIKSLFGKGLDWPIDYDDLRPYYDQVQKEVGISGDAEAEIWRAEGDPYPMPPLQRFRQGELLAAGFKALGKVTAPLPLAINSIAYNGRPPCIYDAWCDAGCPTGALGGNPLAVYFPRARKAGAEFRSGCYVTRVLHDKNGRVEAVEYFQDGERRSLHGDVVVLAAAIKTNIRLLLNSSSGRYPQGLANSSGLVGHYLNSECSAAGYGFFKEETEVYMGVNAGQLTYREGYINPDRPDIFGGYQWQIAPAMKPNDIFGVSSTRADIYGESLHDFIYKGIRHLGMMIGFGGSEPTRENRVELAEVKDQYGFPLARSVHTFSENYLKLGQYMAREAEAVFEAAGAYEKWSTRPGGGHLNGGLIMGVKPDQSVTDSFGRTHDIPNLVIAGGCLFPSGGGVSPTFSIHAVSLRSVRHIIDHWSDVTL